MSYTQHRIPTELYYGHGWRRRGKHIRGTTVSSPFTPLSTPFHLHPIKEHNIVREVETALSSSHDSYPYLDYYFWPRLHRHIHRFVVLYSRPSTFSVVSLISARGSEFAWVESRSRKRIIVETVYCIATVRQWPSPTESLLYNHSACSCSLADVSRHKPIQQSTMTHQGFVNYYIYKSRMNCFCSR